MNISADQAKTLLDDRSPMGREWHPVMQFSARHAAVVNEDGECIMPIRYAGECTSFNDGDIRLAAAAPDLARTVIEQAEEIEKLRSTVVAFINKRTEFITALLNSPEANADYWRWQGHAESRRQLAQELGWSVPHNPGETTEKEGDQ